MQKGMVFNIQRFSVNDGPGIRTTVFYKGCPLNCLWCHNPESKSKERELLFDSKRCVLCGACAAVCPQGCHSFDADEHLFDRTKCIACGACAEACAPEALELVGQVKTVAQMVEEVLKDQTFYETSGGGVTLSGGEPLYQPEFTYALLTELKNQGLHTCVETCGFASAEYLQKIAPLVDIFLFDYKVTDGEKHKQCTGVSNEQILKNLKMLDAMSCKTILRCPIIPGINDTTEHFAGIANMANNLQNVLQIDVEPYHPLGAGKARNLGKDYPLGDLTFPENETVETWIKLIAEMTAVAVKKG